MNPIATDPASEDLQDLPAPACVMSFNASDATGAGGIAGDIATIAAMGAHALPYSPRRACACTRRANALQSNHAGGVAAAPINLSLKRK